MAEGLLHVLGCVATAPGSDWATSTCGRWTTDVEGVQRLCVTVQSPEPLLVMAPIQAASVGGSRRRSTANGPWWLASMTASTHPGWGSLARRAKVTRKSIHRRPALLAKIEAH